MMYVMPSKGSPTDVSTSAIVTIPPCGIPEPPMAATVAVMLELQNSKRYAGTHVKCLSYWAVGQ